MSSRILFVCKNREQSFNRPEIDEAYSEFYCTKKSSGLSNSVKFVASMLKEENIECKVVDVQDNNAIDREVTLYKPTHVIIEALWVVPSKFEVLTKLHPSVKWIVRLHSEIPFIANEGIAMEWIFDSAKYPNVVIACNSKRIADDLRNLLCSEVMYLPNYYDVESVKNKVVKPIEKNPGEIHIGCFGAVRPLKNHLIQAGAAMDFADAMGLSLHFHINASRIEGKGDPVLKNIQKLFDKNLKGHKLVEHDWMNHDTFVGLVGQMDISMQVSFTETYNIVTADAVSQGVPVVTSPEIPFVACAFRAHPTDSKSITHKLFSAYLFRKFSFVNKLLLKWNAYKAKKQWLKSF